jgi:hypothetical protein
MWWLYCVRQILANNKDMVAREGRDPPPPAPFQGLRACYWLFSALLL